MKLFGDLGGKYLEEMNKRGQKSRVYREFQLIGLEISQILGDNAHKALYIKLAKKFDKSRLLSLAKSVAEKKDILNRGAYFMKVLHSPATTSLMKNEKINEQNKPQ